MAVFNNEHIRKCTENTCNCELSAGIFSKLVLCMNNNNIEIQELYSEGRNIIVYYETSQTANSAVINVFVLTVNHN